MSLPLHTLQAATVGTWRPQVQVGASLRPGQLVGHLVRLGRRLEVRVPADMEGVARTLAPAGGWVEHGTTLVSLRAETVAALPATTAPEEESPRDMVVVRSATDGVIWLGPEPGAQEFAPQGRFLTARDTLALVEVMKTFTPVRSPGPGVVGRVLVTDGQPVQAGQGLFWIRVARRQQSHESQAS